MLHIRMGTEEDIPAIFALIKSFADFQKTPEKVHITVEQMMADKGLFNCFVMEDEATGAIVGFASFFFAYYSWSGKALYLDDLYVQENFRGLQAGSMLMQAVVDFAKNNDCKTMRWLVSAWNTRARQFYKQLGAVMDETDITCQLTL